MGNVDDALALAFQRADDFEKMVHFAFSQRGCRLIHNQYVGLVGYCFGDFHHLPVGHAKAANFNFRIKINIEPLEKRSSLLAHLAVIDKAPSVLRLAANPDIFSNGHWPHQV